MILLKSITLKKMFFSCQFFLGLIFYCQILASIYKTALFPKITTITHDSAESGTNFP